MSGTYRLHGLDVVSPYPMGHRCSITHPDVTFTVERARRDTELSGLLPGRRIAHLAHQETGRLHYELADQGDIGTCFRFHGLADLRIPPDQETVRCILAPDADEKMMHVFLPGTVIAAMLMLRGWCVLHASAVEREGEAVALVGRSGAGKSTLAALSCLAGTRLVTDDVLHVFAGSDGISCHRGASELRLRPTSKALAETGTNAPDVTADDRHLLRIQETPYDELPLRAVVFPRLRDADQPLLRAQVSPRDALFAMLACPRVYNWEDQPTAAAQLIELSSLVEQVPAYTLDVPWGVEVDESRAAALVDALFDDLS